MMASQTDNPERRDEYRKQEVLWLQIANRYDVIQEAARVQSASELPLAI